MDFRSVVRVLLLGLVLCAGSPAKVQAEDMLAGTAATEALQHRLTDAACYGGPVDGKTSEALAKAVSICPTQDPQLRIETGFHIAPIRRMSVDAACRFAATASEDKTLRVWSLPEGRLQRTIRVPIEEGNGGKIFATAASPDGRWIAAGGWDAKFAVKHSHSVYVFDAATGAVVSRIANLAGTIHALAFSRDERWLAVTLGHGEGLHVFETGTWREIWSDRRVVADGYVLAFAPDGRLLFGADDGRLRLYGPAPGFASEVEVATRGGNEPFSAAVDPKGELIAVGFRDAPRVDVYDLANLRWRFAADTSGIGKGSLRTAWIEGGNELVAGGTYSERREIAAKRALLLFDRNGRAVRRIVTPANDPINQIQGCADGIVISSGEPALGLFDAQGKTLFWHATDAVDMRGKRGNALTVSADGKRVRFGLEAGSGRPVVFELGSGLRDALDLKDGLAPPLTAGLPLSNWFNQTGPRLGNIEIPLVPGEFSRAIAVRSDRSGFVLAGDFSLRAFDASGRQRWRLAAPDIAWGVDITPDGRLVIAAYGDGTIRWHRWSDGKELLALFVNRRAGTWVAWTPGGYFSASAGGERMIGWQLNRGWSQPADFFPASKFRDKFARSDIVERILDTLDEGEAVRLAEQARAAKPPPAPIIETLPPVISILSPGEGSQVDGSILKVDYIVRSPSGVPIDSVGALIDGTPAGTRGLAPIDEVKTCLDATGGFGKIEGALQGCRGSLSLTLSADTSEIGIFARAGKQTSEVAKLHIRRIRESARTPDPMRKPQLYALVVGISDYANSDYRLQFAAKDARDFAAALTNQKGALYENVTVKLLDDREATAVAIKDGLDWLTKQVTEHDVGIVYLAGHGELDERNRFYFLASDSDHTRLRATAVARDDVADALEALAGKAVLFLDACHAGAIVGSSRRSAFDFNGVVNDFARSERGMVVFGASTGRQVSMENPAWGNGAFTKALVEGLGLPGLKAKADLNGDGKITTSVLDAYVAKRVKELTSGAQSPVMTSTAPDFPLAVVR